MTKKRGAQTIKETRIIERVIEKPKKRKSKTKKTTVKTKERKKTPVKKRKKTLRKKTIRKPQTKKIINEKPNEELNSLQEKLIENTISLQKIITNLTIKLDQTNNSINSMNEKIEKMSTNTLGLLHLFDEATKQILNDKGQIPELNINQKTNPEIEDKLERIINQNSILTKTILQEKKEKPEFDLPKEKEESKEENSENKEKGEFKEFLSKYQEPISKEPRKEDLAKE